MIGVPVEISSLIPQATRSIQVIHCRKSDCDNYGVSALTKRVKLGPSADRDSHYSVQSTNKGRVPCIKCKCCCEKPPIKSNTRIAKVPTGFGNITAVFSMLHNTEFAFYFFLITGHRVAPPKGLVQHELS